jgi:hypothetical protein
MPDQRTDLFAGSSAAGGRSLFWQPGKKLQQRQQPQLFLLLLVIFLGFAQFQL